MDELKDSLVKNRIFGYIAIAVFFTFISLFTFIGTRYIYPIIVYGGRTSFYSLPAGLTYLMPLVMFYFILVSMYSKTIKGRLQFIKILGIILLVVGLFNEVDITICITLIWGGRTNPGLLNPIFPYDIILINILYLLCSAALLLYRRIDNKYVLSVGVSSIPLTTPRMITFGFFIPFASYFLGEFLFGFIFLEEMFVDPNWHFMIPHYLSFLLPAIYFGLYMGLRFLRDHKKKKQFALSSLIFICSTTIGVFTWLYAGLIMNPYLIEESLQWEYALALPLKFPLGIIVTTLICAVICITATIKFILIKRRQNYEQKQEKI